MSFSRNIVMSFVLLFVQIFIFLCCTTIQTTAQGFDWQYSSRLPTGYPRLFLGVVGSGMQSQHTATMRYLDFDNGKECDCEAVFNRATSIDFTGGIIAEYWLPEANMAIYGVLQAEQRNAVFEANGRVLPVSSVLGGGDFTTKYTLTANSLNASIEAGLKVKFASMPLYAALGLQAASVLVKQFDLKEISTNARFLYSAENLPTSFVQLHPFILGGKVSVGGDFALTKSVYASPALFVSAPFGSVVLGGNTWSRLSYGVQVAVLLGFLP
jgi:hypothetical protein